MCKKKKLAIYDNLHIFEKPKELKYAKIFATFLKPKCVSRKIENVQVPIKASLQKSVQNFFAKFVHSASFSLDGEDTTSKTLLLRLCDLLALF